jgi:hypothetical protein
MNTGQMLKPNRFQSSKSANHKEIRSNVENFNKFLEPYENQIPQVGVVQKHDRQEDGQSSLSRSFRQAESASSAEVAGHQSELRLDTKPRPNSYRMDDEATNKLPPPQSPQT